jgi:5-methylcytosine-specific restriction endonuclease McrA
MPDAGGGPASHHGLRGLRQRLANRRAAARAVRRNRSEGSHCFYCGAAFEQDGPFRRTVDHRVPRSLGGTDGLANLVFACEACNQRKADGPEDRFVGSEWLRVRRAEVGEQPPPES